VSYNDVINLHEVVFFEESYMPLVLHM